MNEAGETEFQREVLLKKKKQILKEPIAYHFVAKTNMSYYFVGLRSFFQLGLSSKYLKIILHFNWSLILMHHSFERLCVQRRVTNRNQTQNNLNSSQVHMPSELEKSQNLSRVRACLQGKRVTIARGVP